MSKSENVRKVEESEKEWRLALEEVEAQIAVVELHSLHASAALKVLQEKWETLKALKKAESEGLGFAGLVRALAKF